LELLGVAVAGAVGLAILVYTVQSLVAPPRQEETYWPASRMRRDGPRPRDGAWFFVGGPVWKLGGGSRL